MTAGEVAAYVESLVERPGPEDRFLWGDAGQECTGVLVTWMATLEAIAEAATSGCNLIICHESLHFPYEHINPGLEHYTTWTVNRLRLTALAKQDLVVYRSHNTLDRFCILRDFTDLLGLTEQIYSSDNPYYLQVFAIPPCTLGDLAEEVKRRVGMPVIRVAGDPKQLVSKVACPWGGVGLSLNMSAIEAMIAAGADVLIAGECDEYAMRYALDAGVPMIETSHAGSENPGLKHFAEHLSRTFPDLNVVYHEVPGAWTCR